MATPESYEVIKKSSIKKASALQMAVVAFFLLGLCYLAFQVTMLSKKVSAIKVSDDKIEYVYGKVGELVKILDSREDVSMSVDYNPNEQYDFKSGEPVQELTAEEPATAQENREALKQELKSMDDDEKLKVVRDKLVDIFQKSKTRDEELTKVKQVFYDVKTLIEAWYNDKKGIKSDTSNKATTDAGMLSRLKENLGHFVQVNKVEGEDLSKTGKKLLTVDQIPQLLGYAEILMEAGSLSQAAWVLEDVQTITKQQEILSFSAKVEEFNKKFPNSNADMQQIKELIDIIENQE